MRRPQWIPARADAPGVALAFAVGGLAVFLVHALPPSPLVSDVLLAMLLGMLVLNTPLARVFGLGPVGKEREPDRYAAGLRFTGKWVLRLSIILMGMKVQTSFFGGKEIALVGCVAAAAIPSTFFVAHVFGAVVGVRRPLVDLLAGGTMICGASAVNAVAPVARAHREEQGIAIGVVFLFSVVAMFAFRPIASSLGLDASDAGLWSGLAVNDLSSAVAVGAQMGESGGVMAAASKSARILLLGPVIVSLSLLRSSGQGPAKGGLARTIVDALPGFLLGYVGLAVVRAVGDHLFGASPAWAGLLAANRIVLDVLLSAVAAGIGLHLALGTLLGSSGGAVVVGGGASVWMAALTVAMITLWSRGSSRIAIAVGVLGLFVSFVPYRLFAGKRARLRAIMRRFDAGGRLSLDETTTLLDARERRDGLDEAFMRGVIEHLSPAIGELIPARTSPLAHGQGCRWMTYWEGKSGWALVAIVREPGATTPIHAHPHRMLGKAIEGRLEELRFRELLAPKSSPEAQLDMELELVSREVLTHEELVVTDGLATVHVVRAVGDAPSIDLQLRGPEVGVPGRVFTPKVPVDVLAIDVGSRFFVREKSDERPGHGGEGARAGRLPEENG